MNGRIAQLASLYVLDDEGRPRAALDPAEVTAQRADPGRWRVARERVGEVEVSTVFLFHDHRLAREGDPILWETAVIAPRADGGDDYDIVDRYTTLADARFGHAAVVEGLRATEGEERP